MFCFKIVAVLGMDMHFCDPNQLIATKQRNKLAAANKVLCFLPSRADRSKRTSIIGFCDMRLFELEAICEKCLARDCAQEAATRIGRGGC